MPPLATKDQIFQELWNNGFFSGFDVILRKYHPDLNEAGAFKSFLYGRLLEEIAEAKKEATHLLAALNRMETRCKQGKAHPGNPRLGWDSVSSPLQGDVQTIDGWVVSLFESNITLLHYIMSFETAANRSNTIHGSMRAVIEKRRTERKLFESDPAAFKLKLM